MSVDRHGHRRAGRATGASRDATPALVLARAAALLHLLRPVPGRAAGVPRDRQLRSTRRATRPCRTTPTCPTRAPRRAFRNSIEISLVTAIVGGLFGFALAGAVILGGLPRFLRSSLMTFSGVASNFAGIPLALAFTYTLGQHGLVTVLLKDRRDRHLGRRLQILQQARPRDRLPLLPVPAHGADHGAGHRRAAARVARGGREHGRDPAPVLAARRPADPHADDARQHDPAVRQLVRRAGDGLSADGRPGPARPAGHRQPDQRRRPPQRRARLRDGDGRRRDHGDLDRRLHASSSGDPSGGCDDRRPAAGHRPRAPGALESVASSTAATEAAAAVRCGCAVGVGRLHHRRALLLRAAHRDLRGLDAGEAGVPRAYTNALDDPGVLVEPRLLLHRRRHHRRPEHRPDRPDRVLGPAPGRRASARSSSW